MRPLDVIDVIPRNQLAYEQWKPKDIELKASLQLTKASLSKIVSSVARPYVRPTSEQGHKADVGATPAMESSHNQAGVLIRPNEHPLPEERCMWDATLHEIKGFNWQGPRQAEDPEPPTYRVGNIRREGGSMYAVVTTSHHEVQYDHSVADVRRRMYRVCIADKLELLPPRMLSWATLKDSRLTLDFSLLRECALHYQDVMR
jgi:hypothetical protein